MDLLNLAVFQSLFGGQRKPYVRSYSGSTAAAASISVTIPRSPGKLCIVVVTAVGGGTATPGLLTGFTSLASGARAANVPGYRIQYKVLNGSEAVTLSSAATSATTMAAAVFLVDGNFPTKAPTISTVSTTNTPGTLTAPNPPGACLVMSFLLADTLLTATEAPPKLAPFFFNAGNATAAILCAWRNGFTETSIDVGAWVATVGVTPRTFALAVRSD